jgi:poly(A) polymerase
LDKIEPLATPEEVQARKGVLSDIQKIINKWVQEVSAKQGFTGESLKMACGKVFTFGSFRLGLITPASDIDALCVAPKHINREDFFASLLPILEANPVVTEITGVPDAVVPIIKMKYKGIEVDLTFARLNLAIVDSKLESLASDNLLKHLDEKTVRSINGTRVADALLALVPNQATYITVLRFTRHWAKQRGLYSNAIGFFGGITWAILSARVCQMYPNFTPLQICRKFFLVFARWNWSSPVTLCPITQSSEVGLMGFKVWNPKINASDRFHLMPIVTPSFPCMNSTYNVTETTRRILTAEFARAHDLLAQDISEASLAKICRSPPFLSLFNVFLVVDVFCGHEGAFSKIKGFVESRLRMLLKFLESPASGVQSSRPWPKEIELKSDDGKFRTVWLIGLSFPPAKAGGSVADLRPAISSYHEKLADWNEKLNYTEGEDFSVRLFHVSRTSEFVQQLEEVTEGKIHNAAVSEYLERVNAEVRESSGGGSWSLAQAVDEPSKKRKLDLVVQLADGAA